MTDLQNELYEMVNRAIERFNVEEEYLIINDLSERCICAKFSWYLQEEIRLSGFKDHHVDVEYNRGDGTRNDTRKKLDDKNIVVDSVVHKRESEHTDDTDNLICIEMKKANDKRNLDHDKMRLKAMTSKHGSFQYQAGYMIII